MDDGKETKEEAGYKHGILNHCRNCTNFHPNARRCARVRGPIDPWYWCELFKARR